MLRHKFFVPYTSRLLNLRELSKVSCSNKIACKMQESVEKGRVKHSRCSDYKRALEKCPKDNIANRCRKHFFPNNVTPQPKCNWSSADYYRRAYEAIKIRSMKLTELVETISRLMVREMRNEIAKSRCNENSHSKRILKIVEPHILELSNLDSICAMKKKRDVFTLNDRTYQELTRRDCETELGLLSIEYEIEKLIRDTKSKADASLALVYACRKSISGLSPENLMSCVEQTSREAAKLLDVANSVYEARIDSIKKAKEEMLCEDTKIFKQVTAEYEKNISKLLSEIINCIRERKSR